MNISNDKEGDEDEGDVTLSERMCSSPVRRYRLGSARLSSEDKYYGNYGQEKGLINYKYEFERL